MQYIPQTEETEKIILDAIGVRSFEQLIENIPVSIRQQAKFELPEPLSEMEVSQLLSQRVEMNKRASSFIGGGSYDHFIPAVVDFLISRSEFYTAYTPYQAEVSQGTLQAMYEYQSMICLLTGMDVANASMYDGASAFAEAAMMAGNITRKSKVLISSTISPDYKRVLNTYLESRSIEIAEIPEKDGITDVEALKSVLSDEIAAVLIQNPNFFGNLEKVSEIGEFLRDTPAIFISCIDPISLGILKPPGEYHADIAVGEGQPLGIHQSFGGPFLGIFAAREKFVRQLPGRIAGKTVDTEGKTGFVLTLQTREQHIRRERATSNICTNQQLNALAATIYLSLMGKEGLRKVALLCLEKSHNLMEKIERIPGYSACYRQPFFKEFVVKTPVPASEIIEYGIRHGVHAGIDLGKYRDEWKDRLMIAVTEKRTETEIDQLVDILKNFSS